MSRGISVLFVAAALNTLAFGATPASWITGQVKNAGGVPQMGAVVQLFSSERVITVYTDDKGRYSATLLPGMYQLKVSAPSFLPSLRENVAALSGAHLVVDLTLNTLIEALQLIPLPSKNQKPLDPDDWKWTLRSSANRPILRVVDGSPLVVTSTMKNPEDRILKARVAFLAGDMESAAGQMSTAFNLDEALSESSTLSLNGNVSYGAGGSPGGMVQAVYRRERADGTTPQLTVTMRRFANLPGSPADALALKFEDDAGIEEYADIHYGMEAGSVQFRSTSLSLHPFAVVDAHLGPDAVLEYRFATDRRQNISLHSGDSASSSSYDSNSYDSNGEVEQTFGDLPYGLSLHNHAPTLEQAQHHELSLSTRHGGNAFEIAAFEDRLRNTALMGISQAPCCPMDDLLVDVESGTLAFNAGAIEGGGTRLLYSRDLPGQGRLAFDYSFGPSLQMDSFGRSVSSSSAVTFRQIHTHSLTGKFEGKLPGAHTRVVTAYKWSSDNALLPADLFNATPAQADPYLSIDLRQPIPARMFLPKGLEALIDVRNLLAEGYRPVMGRDGRTMYLVQAPRSVRGGVTFTF